MLLSWHITCQINREYHFYRDCWWIQVSLFQLCTGFSVLACLTFYWLAQPSDFWQTFWTAKRHCCMRWISILNFYSFLPLHFKKINITAIFLGLVLLEVKISIFLQEKCFSRSKTDFNNFPAITLTRGTNMRLWRHRSFLRRHYAQSSTRWPSTTPFTSGCWTRYHIFLENFSKNFGISEKNL